MKVSAWIGNLGKYNEGELVGEWVDFPITEETFEEVMERIGIGERYEEWFAADYDSPLPLHKMFGEYPSFESLNEIAETVDDMGDEEETVLDAILQNYTDDVSEALRIIEDGDYRVWSDCYSMTDVAYEYVEETGMLDKVPEALERYFDYEAFGRDLDLNGMFYEVDCKTIVEVL